MNVWVAYMNLENIYGTQESLLKVFDRAVQSNDPKKVYLHLVKIYERTNKLEVCPNLSSLVEIRSNPIVISTFFFEYYQACG